MNGSRTSSTLALPSASGVAAIYCGKEENKKNCRARRKQEGVIQNDDFPTTAFEYCLTYISSQCLSVQLRLDSQTRGHVCVIRVVPMALSPHTL